MKTEEEIKTRLERLEKKLDSTYTNPMYMLLEGMVDELRWVLKDAN